MWGMYVCIYWCGNRSQRNGSEGAEEGWDERKERYVGIESYPVILFA